MSGRLWRASPPTLMQHLKGSHYNPLLRNTLIQFGVCYLTDSASCMVSFKDGVIRNIFNEYILFIGVVKPTLQHFCSSIIDIKILAFMMNAILEPTALQLTHRWTYGLISNELFTDHIIFQVLCKKFDWHVAKLWGIAWVLKETHDLLCYAGNIPRWVKLAFSYFNNWI